MARIFITGSRGYLGECVTAVLRGCGHDVTAFPDRLAALPPCSVEADVAVHLAAVLPARLGEDAAPELLEAGNLAATRHLVASLARKTRIVYVSSRAVYGPGTGGAFDETVPPNPTTPYGRGKLEAERAIADSGHPCLALRSTVLYGHGVNHDGLSFVTRMTDAALSAGQISVTAGTQAVDALHVWDLAAIIRLLCERQTWPDTVLNVSGRQRTVLAWGEDIGAAVRSHGLPCELHEEARDPPQAPLLDSRRLAELIPRDRWTTDPQTALAALVQSRLRRRDAR